MRFGTVSESIRARPNLFRPTAADTSPRVQRSDPAAVAEKDLNYLVVLENVVRKIGPTGRRHLVRSRATTARWQRYRPLMRRGRSQAVSASAFGLAPGDISCS